jgi:hypothetical protein
MAPPMKPFDDPLTLATMQTTARLARKATLDAVDLRCRSRSLEALAISRELLAMPLYRPLRGVREGADEHQSLRSRPGTPSSRRS